MIMNVLVFVVGVVTFITFCSEEQSKSNFVFQGWILSSYYFGNIDKVNSRKKQSAESFEKMCYNSQKIKKEIDYRLVRLYGDEGYLLDSEK